MDLISNRGLGRDRAHRTGDNRVMGPAYNRKSAPMAADLGEDQAALDRANPGWITTFMILATFLCIMQETFCPQRRTRLNGNFGPRGLKAGNGLSYLWNADRSKPAVHSRTNQEAMWILDKTLAMTSSITRNRILFSAIQMIEPWKTCRTSTKPQRSVAPVIFGRFVIAILPS